MKVKAGQYWKGPTGPVIQVLTVVKDAPEDEPRKAGTVQVKRLDTGFVFWTYWLDLEMKMLPVSEKDLPLVLLGGY